MVYNRDINLNEREKFMNDNIIIKGLGYRELEKLASVLAEIAAKGEYQGYADASPRKFEPEIEGNYDPYTDTITINGATFDVAEI